jgi:hypothetical protein
MNKILMMGLALALGACASADGPRTTAPRASSTLIAEQEVRDSKATNALELIQNSRPGWLRKHGTVSFRMDGEILVYLDEVRLGGIDTLQSLALPGIHSIRFLDAVTASARFGLNHPHGAIQVRSR